MMNISGTTQVYGIIGDPVEHTMSPLMHNCAIAEMGIDAIYVPFHVQTEQLESAVRGMKALSIMGLNVTVPHKTRIIEYLDSLTDEAKIVGAVNTIINDKGVLRGENTDVYGFLMCLTRGSGLKRLPEHICVIGAGGAARGVVYACAMRKEVSEITIINRTLSKAEKIANEYAPLTGTAIKALPAEDNIFLKVLTSAGLIVNTTSVGMHPHIEDSPVPDPKVFHEGQVVCDIIYNPVRTRLLRDAASQGARTVEGLAMLAYQGARSLSLWTGMDAPVKVMLHTLKRKFAQK